MASLNDFFFGSPGTSSTFYPPPIYPPGWGFAQSFWDQIMPGLMNMPQPQYPGQLDPGLSPTAAGAIRMGQNQAMSPVPEMFGPLYGTLGQYMQGPQEFRPQRGPGQGVLQSFMGVNQKPYSASNWQGQGPNWFGGGGQPQQPQQPQPMDMTKMLSAWRR